MPPLKTDQHFAKSALANVVARAYHQRPVGSFDFVRRGCGRMSPAAGGAVEEDQILFKGLRLRRDVAIGRKATLEPSKIRLSLPPTWFT